MNLSNFPTAEQVNAFKASAQRQLNTINEGRDHRMKMYYDCVDDYSWGGLCDKAADESASTLRCAMNTLDEQLSAGAPFKSAFTTSVLMDLEGNIVSERIVDGKFGRCWIIKDGEKVTFVSLAAKAGTYAKKGYKVANRVYECEYFFTTRIYKDNLCVEARVVSEKLEMLANVKEACTYIGRILWFAKNK